MDNITFAVLGGDIRQKILCKMLRDDGFVVTNTPVLSKHEIIIGPIPCSRDGITLFQTEGEPIIIEELFKKMDESNVRFFIAGGIKDEIRNLASGYNIRFTDVLDIDEVAMMNAVPTAEGAVARAMENSDITIFGSRCLVLGYGRCGKILANTLKGLNAHVYVGARPAGYEGLVKSYGLGFIDIGQLESYLTGFDFIFNTIPSMILDGDALEKVRTDCIIIDISSNPGGVDFPKAKQRGIKTLHLLGLPGKVAPQTAALIIKEAIIKVRGV